MALREPVTEAAIIDEERLFYYALHPTERGKPITLDELTRRYFRLLRDRGILRGRHLASVSGIDVRTIQRLRSQGVIDTVSERRGRPRG